MMVILHIHLLLSFFPFPSLIFQSAWHFAFECLYHRVHLPSVCFATFWGGLLSSQFIFFSTALFVDHLLCFCYLTSVIITATVPPISRVMGVRLRSTEPVSTTIVMVVMPGVVMTPRC